MLNADNGPAKKFFKLMILKNLFHTKNYYGLIMPKNWIWLPDYFELYGGWLLFYKWVSTSLSFPFVSVPPDILN